MNSAKISTDKGIFIATVWDRAADGNARGADGNVQGTGAKPDDVVPRNELSWQLWERETTARGGDISNLNVLVAESVQSPGTPDTIKAAIGKWGHTLEY